MPRTYLNESIKDGAVMRWTINPLVIYVAPMRFYSKQGEDYKYRKMVLDAFNTWAAASGGKIRFNVTDDIYSSNINVVWRRVDRKTFGHCNFNWDPAGRLYGAEVSIGLSDGRIHKAYDNEVEVYHTILHEVGHSLGLGHSPYKNDIMYSPHQYGNASLSENDVYSIQWLYRLPAGASVKKFASKYSISTTTDIDAVIRKIDSKENDGNKQEKLQIVTNRDLLQESVNIGDLNKYNMSLQGIELSQNVKNYIKNKIK